MPSKAPADPVARVTEKDSTVGSSATEATEEAVSPTGPVALAAVMRATPAGWCRNASL
ncbi:hypothetical protein Agsp01_25370 [Agromyces sp. NBRC 114283]|nr:hypothetical protein Agsp01_25370 [Agromyces sp. NBRC 114283]